MKWFSVTAAVLAAGFLSGCSQSTDPEPIGSSAFDAMGMVSFPPLDVTTPRTEAEMVASSKLTRQALEAVAAALADADPSDAPDLHRRIQGRLDGLDGEVRALAEQLAAAAMLRAALVPAADTDETREIAAVYTGYLVDRKSPQADLVLDGLNETGEAWTPVQRQRAATVAITAAERREAITRPETFRRLESAGASTTPVTDAAMARLRTIAQGA